MKTGKLTIKGTVQKSWQKIYESTLAAAATSVTISGLDGDTDVEYRLVTRVIVNAVNLTVYLRPNNDTTSNIYGYQRLYGSNTTVGAGRSTGSNGFWIATDDGTGTNIDWTEVILYAKSGYVRTAIINWNGEIATTTIGKLEYNTWSWNNTSSNITSLVLFCDQTNGIGIGTYIALYRRRA